jgi:hypothetical protein
MISGTIGYIKLKHDDKEYLFFLDNHEDETYCLKNKIFLHDIFDKLYQSYNLFIEEPIIESDLELQYKSEHVLKYLEYIKNKDVIKFDIRFTNLNIDEIIELLDNYIKDNSEFPTIVITHLNKIKELYIKYKKGGKYISIYQPFTTNYTIDNELILDVLMEFYLILMLIRVTKKNNIIYSGAGHCIVITKLLVKFYDFQLIEDTTNLDLNETLDLNELDKFPNCVNLSNLLFNKQTRITDQEDK